MDYSQLRVNGDRLNSTIDAMAKIGGTTGGGMRRLTLTDEDRQGRDQFVKWLKDINADVTIDEMGSIFGRLPGKNNDLPPVMFGSHLDTQPDGGRFDGILGVLSGLEVLRTLKDNNIVPERPVVVVDWTNEEGCRFPPAMLASGVWAGKLDRDWAYSRKDASGKTFLSELERIGYKGDAPAAYQPFHAYYEYHIEQGPRLEREGKTIGIPKGILCLHWYDITVTGTSNQVGPTPMEGRRDPLCAVAEMILKVNQLPGSMGGNMVATVGEINNYPNSRNIIPGRVHFTVDIRSWDDDLAARSWEKVKAEFLDIAAARGCGITTEETWRAPHAPFDETLVGNVEEAASRLGYSHLRMVSGAGHDASYMAMVGPTAMIFVPSQDGRSHVEVEYTSPEDCVAGANVLLQCVLKSAMEK